MPDLSANFPEHVDIRTLRPDPHGRANHLLHPETHEVFSVDGETYQAVIAQNRKASSELLRPARGVSPVNADQLLQPVEGEGEADWRSQKFGQLKTMAAHLGISVRPGTSTAQLVEQIEAALADAQKSHSRPPEEFRQMAADLGLTIGEEATDAEVEAAVLATIAAA